jgi:TRAP-type C4-dicarboxylate transport system permease small subunit
VSRCIYLLIAGFGLIMVICGIQLVEFMTMSTLPATKISSSVEYVVIPISGAMLIYNSLEQLFQPYGDFLNQCQTIE